MATVKVKKVTDTAGKSTLVYATAELQPAQAFAQVTVVDGDHGDCNIVDLCQYLPAEALRRKEPVWRRVLVDTGYNKADGVVANAIFHALTKRGAPVPDNAAVMNVPPMSQIQITHFDVDHIGNAGTVLNLLGNNGIFQAWQTANPNYNCEAYFANVPPAFPTLIPTFCLATYEDPNISVKFAVKGLREWLGLINQIGILPSVNLTYELAGYKLEYDATMEEWCAYLLWPKTVLEDFLKDYNASTSEALTFSFSIEIQIQEETDTLKGRPIMVDNWEEYVFEFKFSKIIAWIVGQWGGDDDEFIALVKDNGYANLCNDLMEAHVENRNPPYKLKDPSGAVFKEKLHDMIDAVYNFRKFMRHTHPQIDNKWGVTDVKNPTTLAVELPELINQITVSPPQKILRDLGRYLVAEALSEGAEEIGGRNLEIDIKEIVLNRASIVTTFLRPDLELSMLFTGDAYDQSCDIQNTLANWKGLKSVYPINFSVLKVPHHGSNITATSDFYDQVRAEVYIISAAHAAHGNPKFSSLKAIITGFEGQTMLARTKAQ
ncbi:hypothetical protein ABW19_dt0210422 [Dactylella cylindrospora]|nr:hypothetical protein ABW19_dt0210422 [Dactylella cylindrospora]